MQTLTHLVHPIRSLRILLKTVGLTSKKRFAGRALRDLLF